MFNNLTHIKQFKDKLHDNHTNKQKLNSFIKYYHINKSDHFCCNKIRYDVNVYTIDSNLNSCIKY